MSTLHPVLHRVSMHDFTRGAESLLKRSPRYLAVAFIRGEEVVYWVERSLHRSTDSRTSVTSGESQNQPLRLIFQPTLGSIKHLALTLPRRGHEDDPISLSLSYQLSPHEHLSLNQMMSHLQSYSEYFEQNRHEIDEGSVYAVEHQAGLLLLFTLQGELAERAHFWLRHCRSRLS